MQASGGFTRAWASGTPLRPWLATLIGWLGVASRALRTNDDRTDAKPNGSPS
jgi:hypothetical protein